jgi:hypothetical protein
MVPSINVPAWDNFMDDADDRIGRLEEDIKPLNTAEQRLGRGNSS